MTRSVHVRARSCLSDPLRSAWNKLGKMSKEDAMKTYISLLQKVDPKFKSSLATQLPSKL